MSDTQIFFSSIHDICRPVAKDDFNPAADENIVFARTEAPQFPPVSRLISDDQDEFIGCRTLYNTRTGSGPAMVRHAGRGVSFLAHLKDAALIHDVMCVVASENRFVFPNSFNEFSIYGGIDHYTSRSYMTYAVLKTGARGERSWEHYLREPSPQSRNIVIEAPHILMSNMVSMSYFHFMIDVVPRLWIFDEWPELRKMQILISPMGEKFEQALADLIGVPRSQFFVVHPGLLARFSFRHLIYPSGFCDRMITRDRLDFIRAKTAPGVDLTSTKPHRRVYLSRVDRPYRTAGNELEIRNVLQSYGFEILLGSAMSVAEQAKLFSETEMLVGIGGGGSTNLLFMQPGSVMLELTQRHPSVVDGGNIIFLELASLRGVNHLMMSSQWDTFDLQNGFTNLCAEHPSEMYYNMDRLRAAVEEGIALIGSRP